MSHKNTPSLSRENSPNNYLIQDPWSYLKDFTDARIALGRAGVSLPLKDLLAFRLDHAKARDAVWSSFPKEAIERELNEKGFRTLLLESCARDKREYLARPDLGRVLTEGSRAILKAERDTPGYISPEVLVVISDGLSARAIIENAVPLTVKFLSLLKERGYTLPPVPLVSFGRVAAADEIAEILDAKVVVHLVGERPGLSSPNSMGAYVTYGAYKGILEEARNCISNIRPGGLSIEEALKKLSYIVLKALAIKITGNSLRDDMPENYLPFEENTLFLE
ncbi:MAG: ethanolamine ammonia-lyase subunit EutC [Deltaproteobacteria bacterium]|jgi:ethanolamine ammonia-lyase small subunit|nr:ethanolamine ammonia-lyase subunit EutC [Deltaproteobacteria bacterium]